MRKKTFFTVFLITISFGLCQPLYPWEKTYTHPVLSKEAVGTSQVDNYLRNQLGLNEGLNTELKLDTDIWPVPDLVERGMDPYMDTRTILEWIKEGSKLEDAKLYQARSRHHFHDPTRNTGLDNKTDHPDWWGVPTMGSAFDLTGESALVWAVEGIAEQEPTTNYHTWVDTRQYFYEALTESSQAIREHYLGLTFVAFGHILHMIEDMGVPAHTRNDFLFAHYRNIFDSGNPLEDWVEEQIIANNGQSLWSGTGPVVFDKLAKYFDADVYAGSYVGDGQVPPNIWGLAECTNYQFLSLSTVFGCSGVKYQFPHPAIEHTSELVEGRKVYFDGSNYGVVHLARDSYTHYKATRWGYYPSVIDNTNTTDDEKVFIDYADITIPRTIDYAAGLINYFFRGRLNVEPNWVDPNIAVLTITNDSNNSGVPQVLKGGVFELYWADKDGNRAEVGDFIAAGWGSGSILDYNDTVTATFAKQAGAASYTLVYKGDICENPSDVDADDANAVAVAVFRPGYPIIAWGRDDYGQVSDVPDGNEFIAVAAGKRHCLALKSDGSLVGWGYNTHGECNVPDGTDFTAIAAGTYHSMALKSDGSIVVWGGDNLWQITDKPSGNDFVAITAGDWHSLALKSDGTIVGWGGWNSYGECDAPSPDPGTVYTAIAAGTYHSLALQSDGTVKAWGNNNLGQTRIYDGAGNDHEAVAACANYNLLLRGDDMLISWGGGDWLEPGIPRYHYRQPDSNDFVAIAAGTDHIMALTSDGKVFAWEWPDGDYPFDYFSIPVPEGIVFTDDIAAGYKFSLSLKAP